MSAVAAVVLLVLLVIAAREIDLARVWAELRSAHVRWIIAAIAFYAAILPLWALQWRLLAPVTARNRFPEMLGVVSLTSSTHNTTPFLVSEATGMLLLVTRIGLARAAALSVITMDQLLVGIAKVAVLVTAALTLPLPTWMVSGAIALAVGVAALLTGSLVGAWRYEAIATGVGRALPTRAADVLIGLGRALAPLRSFRRGGGALALALTKKLVEVLAIICVQRAFGVAMPVASAVLVLAALNLATMVPLIPANLGVFEGAVVATYTALGMPPEEALGLAIVQHACYFAALALPGYGWLMRATPGDGYRPTNPQDAA